MRHSDPYTELVTQYKAFAYAIYDQIGGRISREFQHGNLRMLLPAMSYPNQQLLSYGTIFRYESDPMPRAC